MSVRHWNYALATCSLAALLLSWGLAGCTHTSTMSQPTLRNVSSPPSTPATPSGPATAPDAGPVAASAPQDLFIVRLRYVETGTTQQITAGEGLVVTTPDEGLKRLAGGSWRLAHRATGQADLDYPVYVKAFDHNETAALAMEQKQWQDQGYTPFVTTLGRSIPGPGGTVYDGRKYWLGIKRCQSESEAVALKKTLQGQKVWGWSRDEIRNPAPGTVSFQDSNGATVLTSPLPIRIRSTGLVTLENARGGKMPLTVPAPLSISLNRTGQLAIDGDLPLENYLEGILPAEMYPDWPLEALKAQAVAARSEIIAHAAGKHYFDGFDFCIEQHCRAFAGEAGRYARTDQAVRETMGMVLVGSDNAIVPTVFSANCGGWTENNENVWDGAPAAELRGHCDRTGNEGQHANGSVEGWIASHPPSNCAHDDQYYRWSRSLSLEGVSKRLNAQYNIGSLQRVEALERGVSGRLIAIRLVGSQKSEVVRKELNIRKLFDDLPSALCTISVDRKAGVLRVQGAGRGHGVGLCQQGACGMAQANQRYDAILLHYFTGVKITRI